MHSTIESKRKRPREVTGRTEGALLPPIPAVAVNHRHARYDRVIAPGDEVAIIPPVAGG